MKRPNRVITIIERILTRMERSVSWRIYSGRIGRDMLKERFNESNVIVSLTSFPGRIESVHVTIRSLLLQKKTSHRVILWLSADEFLKKEADVPKRLLELKDYGLEIRWCDNIRSYKKLIPTLREYPDAIIVTADDDTIYRSDWLSTLLNEHRLHPNCIISNRVTRFEHCDEGWIIRPGGYDTWEVPSFLHKMTGVGGVLYPPHSLHTDVMDVELAMDVCPTNDDIWFWFMAIRNGRRICVPVDNVRHLNIITVKGTQGEKALSTHNDRGKKLFWRDLKSMFKEYPEVETTLLNELVLMKTHVCGR